MHMIWPGRIATARRTKPLNCQRMHHHLPWSAVFWQPDILSCLQISFRMCLHCCYMIRTVILIINHRFSAILWLHVPAATYPSGRECWVIHVAGMAFCKVAHHCCSALCYPEIISGFATCWSHWLWPTAHSQFIVSLHSQSKRNHPYFWNIWTVGTQDVTSHWDPSTSSCKNEYSNGHSTVVVFYTYSTLIARLDFRNPLTACICTSLTTSLALACIWDLFILISTLFFLNKKAEASGTVLWNTLYKQGISYFIITLALNALILVRELQAASCPLVLRVSTRSSLVRYLLGWTLTVISLTQLDPPNSLIRCNIRRHEHYLYNPW